MLREFHVTLRVALIAAAIVLGAFLLAPKTPKTVPLATANATPLPWQREVQGLIGADRTLAASRGSVPILAAPATEVVREIPGFRGFSPAEVAQMLSALRPPTIERIGAHLESRVPVATSSPPAGWTAAQTQALYAADRAATASVLEDPTTHVAVTITRQEVEPTRVGSLLTPIDGGAGGLSYAIIRRRQLELNVGIIANGQHVTPGIVPAYLIPHTSLSIGPLLTYDHGVRIAVGAVVHF